jgi:flavin reductase (DIM6/NTAB) family NADH-FMN oxidoreductase RutF
MDMMGRLHGDEYDKFELSSLENKGLDTEGNLLLTASDFIYECIVCDTYKNGDHTIFIADVLKIHVKEKQSDQPMLFSGRGRYASTTKSVTAKHPL